MEDKIKAYHKIHKAIYGSKNELHLQTCITMVEVFDAKFNDESMKALLKDEINNKRQRMFSKYLKYEEVY